MSRVIARIIIDTDDWAGDTSPQDHEPVVVWRKIETSHARPFTAKELAMSAGGVGDLYFG